MTVPPHLVELMQSASHEASHSGRPLLGILRERLGTGETDLLHVMAKAFAYPIMAMADLRELAPAFDLLPYNKALEKGCAVCRDAQGRVWLLISDPFDADLLAWVEHRIPVGFSPALVQREEIQAWLHRLEASLSAMDEVMGSMGEIEARTEGEDISLQAIGADASPVVKLVHSTLYDALASGASDIHLENDAQGLGIKYRLDGVLNGVTHVAGRELAEQVVSRIKVMAELDIAERRIPQDGRFKVAVRGRDVDIRVSIMPGAYGEDAVLRVLDRRQLADELKGLTLESLGFEAATLHRLRRLCREPYGMLLVTGPTGSGKTTTLYAAISEINHGQDKIITIEDPVEYQLPGVLQIPVNEKKGLTFARGLRSILRHDPDKIMVGEIRDPETAQIAVQSALTGHLVFTTVHANNVFDVIGRFMHMGVDPYSFVSALNGVLAQRLVRINCPHCSAPVTPDAGLLEESGLLPDQAEGYDFRAGRGCGHCRGTGYKGRQVIAELLLLSDEIRELIVTRAPIRQVKEAAQRQGAWSLRQAALERVRRGETTLEEINRVTFVA